MAYPHRPIPDVISDGLPDWAIVSHTTAPAHRQSYAYLGFIYPVRLLYIILDLPIFCFIFSCFLHLISSFPGVMVTPLLLIL